MSAEYVWGAIFIMMGVTYISRIIPFLLLAGKPVPRWFKTWLTYVPTAIFGALVLPDVFLPAGSLDLGLNNLYLWSTVIIFPLVYKTKSLGLAIVSGVAAASCLWFFGLTGIFKTCCQNLRPSHLQWINRICGAVIFVYALKLLYTFGQML